MHKRETVQTLNTLIQTCRATEDLSLACARTVRTAAFAGLLRSRADDWGRQGDELQALVLTLGAVPARLAKLTASGLCGWVALKAVLLGPSDMRNLEACQHGELRALHRYDQALIGYLPERIRRTLTLHAQRIASRTEAMHVLLGQLSARSDEAPTM
ncbi:MAG: PA2169 family four-helix-bundle protein [Gammaproteobacteria bacterium]